MAGLRVLKIAEVCAHNHYLSGAFYWPNSELTICTLHFSIHTVVCSTTAITEIFSGDF